MNLGRGVVIWGMIVFAALPSEVTAGAVAIPVEPFLPATEPLGITKTLNGTSVICLGRMTTQQEHPSVPFRVVVPLDQLTAAVGRGFMRIDCAGREKALTSYKQLVCKMAAAGNEAVQDRLQSVIGLQPVALCEAAKKMAPEAGDDKLGATDLPPPNLAVRLGPWR